MVNEKNNREKKNRTYVLPQVTYMDFELHALKWIIRIIMSYNLGESKSYLKKRNRKGIFTQNNEGK